MKINLDEMDIYHKSWSYGMQQIATSIIAAGYGLKPDEIPITMVDYQNNSFKGYNPLNMNESFEIQLKIVPKIKFKHSNE